MQSAKKPSSIHKPVQTQFVGLEKSNDSRELEFGAWNFEF